MLVYVRPSNEALPNLLVLLHGKGGLLGLPLRASNEGSPRPRVARAQEIKQATLPPNLRPFSVSEDQWRARN
jgi:hypothetical protein